MIKRYGKNKKYLMGKKSRVVVALRESTHKRLKKLKEGWASYSLNDVIEALLDDYEKERFRERD